MQAVSVSPGMETRSFLRWFRGRLRCVRIGPAHFHPAWLAP
ncbi:hypothetical protein [Methanocalculus chunghsingensis]|nr:hypothetical protein [Methanocalculus chunghsingensis]